jgi:TolA-binding protein
MKNICLPALALLFSFHAISQQTRFYSDPDTKFKEAKEYFQKEQYSLAYPLFKELKQSVRETDQVNRTITVQEINYYTTVCALKQNEKRAENEAITYIEVEKNNARAQMMNYHLGAYYFRTGDYTQAVQRFEQSNISNLSNREVADMKFHQAYALFNLQRFNEAKPLFNTIRTMKEDPNYMAANYYYGFLAFRDRQYGEALESFRVVENDPAYSTVVPYYIAQVYYIQGRKDEAITYIQNKLESGSSSQYYDLELKQLIGHAYFEKKDYAKALPYLEDYVSRSKKVRREDLYELSYAYYMNNQLGKAVEGFRQLSGRDDSLSQHAMYMLGDAYLKLGQKSNARNAFLFGSTNNSNPKQKEISLYQYAKLSYELGYQDEALNSLNTFVSNYPNSVYNTEAKELLIDVLANTNNYRDAQALLESIPNPSETAKRVFPRILFGRAAELINDGQLRDADELLTRILDDPYNRSVLPFTYFWKGEIGYRQNQLDTAIKYYHLYVDAGAPSSGEANPTNARYNLGYAYLRKENYPVSIRYFQPLVSTPALNTDAFSQDVYIRAADNYYMLKDFGRAKTMYDNVVRLSWPAEDYATFQIAMLAGVRSANEKISLMNTMIRKFPNSSLVNDANWEIANTYMSNERWREAIPYLHTLIGAGGNEAMKPSAYLKLGLAHYNLDNANDALKNFRYVVDNYPNTVTAEDALDNIRTIMLEQGMTDDYADYMRSIGRPLTANAEDSLTYYAAESLYDEQKINEALVAFNNYVQRFPNGRHVLEAHFNRAEIYNMKKDWPNAMSAYDQVSAMAPNQYAERAAVQAARISFFELKDYAVAERNYMTLKNVAQGQEAKLEAMRGLLRSQYQLQKWEAAVENAKELQTAKGSSSDDKSLAAMAIAKSHQVAGEHDLALTNFRQVVQNNKAALAAEARYEIASSYFQLNRMSDAEKAAMETISKAGSYDYWITKAYILLGDIYFRQEDYFNAKATLQSVVDNTINQELKSEAQRKLSQVIEAERNAGKIEEDN